MGIYGVTSRHTCRNFKVKRKKVCNMDTTSGTLGIFYGRICLYISLWRNYCLEKKGQTKLAAW